MKTKLVVALIAIATALPALAAGGFIDSNDKVAQIRAGTTTKDLESMVGAPLRKLRFGQREVWEYEVSESGSRRSVLSITLEGGVVRSVTRVSAGGV
jgi:hypothetical protein